MSFQLGRRMVGIEHPTYFIADIASNHDGDLQRACELIMCAAASGAQAVKFQNFKAETIVSDYGFNQLGLKQSHQSNWKESVYDTYKHYELPVVWTPTLKGVADEVGVDYLTTPYDTYMLDYLNKYVCAFKVGSGDITWHQLIKAIMKYDKPIILSTGASTMEELDQALKWTRRNDFEEKVVVMQCNTNYTGDHKNFFYLNLKVIKELPLPGQVAGFSDHTPGHTAVLGAVSLGARVIEKHFTDDPERQGPDHAFSMTPTTFMEMVLETRRLESALGDGIKKVEDNERETVVLQRRAIRATRDIKEGERIKESDLIPLRPCPPDALPPFKIPELVGAIARHDIPKGECVRYSDLNAYEEVLDGLRLLRLAKFLRIAI